jgi:YD repeat-containing protein
VVDNFTYDGLRRRTFAGFGYSGGLYSSTINYTWYGGNRLSKVVDTISGTTTRSYDGLDSLTQETTPLGSISYTYDNAKRRTSMTVAGQTAVNYAWDNANRLTGMTQGTASVGIAYDNSNRRTTLTLPNNVTVAYTYDNDSRVTGISISTCTVSRLRSHGAGTPRRSWPRPRAPATPR